MISKKVKFRILSILSIVFLCIGITIKSFQNDTFYIIKLGNYIFKNGIDFKDHWCWVTSLPYTYPHWLYDVFLYLVYNFFGYLGVYISTIVLFIILIVSIYVINLKMTKNEFLSSLIAIVSLICMKPFVTARGQLISIILLLFEIYFLENMKKRNIIYLCIISLLIANVHATIWPIVFVLYLPYIVEFLVIKLKNKIMSIPRNNIKLGINCYNDKIILEKNDNIKYIFVSFILSLCMGLFSPSKICYTYVFKVMLGDSQKYILEHASMVIVQQPLFLALLVIVLLIMIFTKTKIKLRDLFMLSGLIFMSLFSVRHLMLFIVLGGVFISRLVINFLELEDDKTFDILYDFVCSNNLVCVVLLLMVVLGSYRNFNNSLKMNYVNVKDYPVEAVKYIKKNLDYKNMHLYNDYNYGSYLLFNDVPVFIDSRCDLYLKEFNNKNINIFDDAVDIIYNYESKFKKYKVNYVLIKTDDIFSVILKKDDNYKILYKDSNFVLYERLN